MTEPRKTYKTKIKNAEGFGLFFNCLTRRYLWDYDEGLLNLVLRTMDRYLAYFSIRTLICSIRDLAAGKDGVFCECHEEKPKEQEDRYNLALMRLVKRYLSIELRGSTDKRWNAMRIRELASEGEFTEYYRSRENWTFPSKDAFEQWVYDNNLDVSDDIPGWEGELLPIKADYLSDFCRLCIACVQYSFGRTSYMPSACREFIWDNIALFSDDGLERLVNEIDNRLERFPDINDYSTIEEIQAWKLYSKRLHREIHSRNWAVKAAALAQMDYGQFEDWIHQVLAAIGTGTEDEWVDVWYQMDGIYRYLREKNCSADKKEHKRLIRWAKRFAAQKTHEVWEREEGWKYIKVGPNTYMPRKDIANEKDTYAICQRI